MTPSTKMYSRPALSPEVLGGLVLGIGRALLHMLVALALRRVVLVARSALAALLVLRSNPCPRQCQTNMSICACVYMHVYACVYV